MSAAERWRTQLEAWALPQQLLDSVPDSPYSWPPELWRRRHEETHVATKTLEVVEMFVSPPASVLDVGAGTGRASLPLAERGYRVVGVERNQGMAAGFYAAAAGLDAALIEGSWPDVAEQAGDHGVVMSAHVVYDVQDIEPFVVALDRAAQHGVAVEMTPVHPWAHLTPYYRALHGLDRPDGPSVADFAAVVAACGRTPVVERWSRPGGLRFADHAELLDFFRRRLVLGVERVDELDALLAPDIHEDDGWLVLGDTQRELCTVWWRR